MKHLLCSLLVTVALRAVLADQPWWKTSTFYQVYPRSFMDSTNDGIGDLKGITSKVDYLADLGITAIWMNPIYPSPLADFGYDVSNYTAIDPTFGTMEDIQSLITAFHEKDIKVVLDFVPNHSSDEHPWFNKSINMEGNYTNYYVWRNATVLANGTLTVPNNWQSVFGDSAWKWNENRQQYYLHQFLEKQPDLNFRDANVVQEMKDIMKFWLDLGIDGIRIDAAKYLVEDDEFRDEEVDASDPFNSAHNRTQNQPLTYEICNGWSQLVKDTANTTGKDLIAWMEVYDTVAVVQTYSGGENYPFTIPFNFFMVFTIVSGVTASAVVTVVNSWLDTMPNSSTPNWLVGNHDRNRVATRVGSELADPVNMILAMLPGIMVSYYGEELGMEDTYLTYEQTVDAIALKAGRENYQAQSRDPARTPFQWDDTENAGFCGNATPWLPVNPNYWTLNYEAQKAANVSHMKVFQSLMKLRKSDTFQSNATQYQMQATSDNLFVLLRWADVGDKYLLIVNFGSAIFNPFSNSSFLTSLQLQNTTQFFVNTSSINAGYTSGEAINVTEGLQLRPKAGVILQLTSTTQQYSSSPSTLASSLLMLCVSTCVYFIFS